MTSDSCAVMFTAIKQWNEASSFHGTPKHLLRQQDVEEMGKSRRQWSMTKAIWIFLPPTPPQLFYSSTSYFIFSLSPLQPKFSKSLHTTTLSHSQIWICLFRDSLCLAPLLLNWQDVKYTQLIGFSTYHYSLLTLYKFGMVRSRLMADRGGQSQNV